MRIESANLARIYILETKIQLRMAILRIEIRSGSVVRPSNGAGPVLGSRHSARTKEVRGLQTPWLHNRRRTWMAWVQSWSLDAKDSEAFVGVSKRPRWAPRP